MSDNASGLKEDRKKVFKRAFSMATGTLTSRILGLLRDMALGALFDRHITDAWTAAFRLPNLFRRLFGEGSLSVSFIPVFIEAQGNDSSGARSRNLINGLYTIFLIAFGVLALLGILRTEDVFRLLVSDTYAMHPEKWALTLRLGRIMFGFVFFVCLYAYFMAILNALGSFGLPAVAAALLNISMLLFTFLPPAWFPQMGDGLAWGVLVGGLLQATLLFGALRSQGYLPTFRFSFWNRDVAKVLRYMLPGLAGMGLAQFSTLVNLHFASALPEGAISYIYWADRLLELPLSLISVSLGAAVLPSLSEFAARKETARFREVSQDNFSMNLFLAWPASLGLFFLAQPIVEVLFYRGHFSMQDVVATTAVLKVYALSLLIVSCSRVLMPLYYASQNTWFPAVASVAGLVVHVLLAPSLMAGQGLQGLVVAGLLGGLLHMILLLGGLSFWKLSFDWDSLLQSIVKMTAAGVGMSVVLKIHSLVTVEMTTGPRVLALFVTILGAALIYFGIAALLGSPEFAKIRPLFRRGS
ncbi:MAG: multidrug transporter MurJ [Bdellovibrio sp. ArHS]|uniref:murein biosynthesis integral membrane protein MurJ n=1 Tax=Bdellovibrio sp. ArHS TaxID=1569284 RepID=UPI0005832928|nr:murein biosynthesis integral membrane protein MurJ [Bdellovibrio sp. ArHS]KHD87842.1 MAG: multidrug transporter MurJ [Bdellovibrio sp. ArHS]